MTQRSIAARAATAAAALLGTAAGVAAHPHVFADSRMEIVGTEDGTLRSVRNIWRMDELFSSSVLFDFDKNADGVLDEEELAAVGAVVRESIAEWGFYTFVEIPGREVKMRPPDQIRTLWQDGQLIMFFEMMADETVDLKTTAVTFSVFDDSFFVAFDFIDDTAFELFDLPSTCTKAIDVPDPDAAAADWMASISMLDPNQSVPEDGVEWGSVLSTKARVSCAG
ncbi:DUF1007 family protein [Aureimonas mangrovi]|uniref:DUF1007 family protein n=1 Tax=Aureimonas mangrovi TaxID=2758041 RepID=UPI00163DAC3D|nr:DUF1007 family protein [Aureimonas mangrovi]